VSGGYLNMLMSYETSGACGAGWYTAGMMDSSTAGKSVDARITVRWRVQGTDLTNVRSHRNIPMRWSSVDPWYAGESDYCEGSSLTGCSTFLHHSDPTSVISNAYTGIDMTQWHTWRFEHTGYTVKAYIDDMTTPVWSYTGNATTVPAVPRRVVLQQECRTSGCPAASFAGQTETIQIDWITHEIPSN
jgi:hypothetical protein